MAKKKKILAPKKTTRPPKVTDEEILVALRASGGLISPVVVFFAKRGISITRGAIQQRINSSPELHAAVIDGREATVDNAEVGLRSAIARGEAWAVCFALKCLGKDRGYVERQQIEASVTTAEPVRVVFEYPDNGRMAGEGTE